MFDIENVDTVNCCTLHDLFKQGCIKAVQSSFKAHPLWITLYAKSTPSNINLVKSTLSNIKLD